MSDDRFAKRRRGVRWRQVRPFLLGVAGIAAVSGFIWLVWFSQVLTLRQVDVQGLTTMRAHDVRSQAQAPFGLQLARINTDLIGTRVSSMERVDSVEVHRRWPHRIRIDVAERVPVAWTMAAGSIRQVDRHGVDFRTLSHEPDGLVEIRITTPDTELRQKSLVATARVVAYLRAHGQDVLEEVERISAGTQDSILFRLSGKRTVVWGSAAHLSKKLEVLRPLLNVKADVYDVSAPDLPTTKKSGK